MERIFNLDLQLLVDAAFLALSVFLLYILLSYLLFNPVRNLLAKREEKIKNDIDSAAADKEEAIALKKEYDEKLKEVNKEAEQILSEARKKAMKRENEIIDEAKTEAARIIERANAQIALDKKKAMDDMKQEMIMVASMMAGKVVATQIDTNIQDSLVEETLKEMGDNTWLS